MRCPVPRHPVRPQRIAGSTSPNRARRLPEAEACSPSALTRDAHQTLGAWALSRETRRHPRSESAAPGQLNPLQGQWLRVSWALPLQANPAPAGSGARIPSGKCRSLAPRHRVRVPGEPARAPEDGERASRWLGGGHPEKQGPRGGAGGGTAVPAPGRKPTRSHVRARAHVHTVGRENTSESP